MPLGLTVEGEQATVTDTMVEEAACTATVAAPVLVVSWVLVAVTVMLAGAAGAVNRPFTLIVPALADHATAEL